MGKSNGFSTDHRAIPCWGRPTRPTRPALDALPGGTDTNAMRAEALRAMRISLEERLSKLYAA